MSSALLEPTLLDRPLVPSGTSHPVSAPPEGLRTAPRAQPQVKRRPAPVGKASRLRRSRATSCTMPTPVARSSWRLTERGIVLALVLVAMIVVAAVAVVGLTALRVTGEGYQPSTTAGAAAPAGATG